MVSLISLAKLTSPTIRPTSLDEAIRSLYPILVDKQTEEVAFRRSPVKPNSLILHIRGHVAFELDLVSQRG